MARRNRRKVKADKKNEAAATAATATAAAAASSSSSSSSSSAETPVAVAGCSTAPSPSGVQTRTANIDVAAKLHYEMKYMHVEDHKSPIFCVEFNYFVHDISIFACVAKNRISIYECDLNGKLKFVQVYEDAEEKEKYFTCAWSILRIDGEPESVLAAAGLRGVIQIVRPKTETSISGGEMKHPGEINELKFHPLKRELLLSASKDLTIRLWNVKTSVLVAIFGGVDGHRDSVLSVDFDMMGTRFISCGMDHAIKCWRLDTKAMDVAIRKSYFFNVAYSLRSFKTCNVTCPDYSTREVHSQYIDCIRWFNDLLVSKSSDNMLKIWKLEMHDDKVDVFHDIRCENCDLWFLKFSMDSSLKIIALGNRSGKIFVWNFGVRDPKMIPCTTLTHLRSTSTIRNTALNREGMILIGVGDDGSIWRWDRVLDSTKTAKSN